MLKRLMLTTALSGLLIGAAVAQTSSSNPSSPPPAMAQKDMTKTPASGNAQFIASQNPDQWLASKFRGTEVIGSDSQKIGSVSDVLFEKDGQIKAYIVSVGGFLGMGAKDVALAPGSFQVVPGDKSKNESDKLRLSMTADQLKQAQNFQPYSPPASTTGSGAPMNRPTPSPSRSQ